LEGAYEVHGTRAGLERRVLYPPAKLAADPVAAGRQLEGQTAHEAAGTEGGAKSQEGVPEPGGAVLLLEVAMGDLVRVPQSEGQGGREVEARAEAVRQVHLHRAIVAVDVTMEAGEDLLALEEHPRPEHRVDPLAPAEKAPLVGVAEGQVETKLPPENQTVLAPGQEGAARRVTGGGERPGVEQAEDEKGEEQGPLRRRRGRRGNPAHRSGAPHTC
jgi:hypothetical protein